MGEFTKVLADFDAIEKIVLVQHPSIRQAQKELDAAKNEIESKFGVLLPSADFIVGGAKNFKRGKQPTRYSGEAKFQVDFPVFSGGVDYSGYKQAQIEYRRALHQLDVVRRDVRDNLNATRYDYEIAQKIINARIEAVKASKVAFIGTRKELSVGEKSVLDTLDAETDFLDANISYINANFSRKKLIFQYLDAMGCLNYSVLSRAIN